MAEPVIEHYGVPGMRWGRRKPEEVGAGRQPAAQQPKRRLSANNQKAVTAAFAVGVVVVGAVLLKRGNVKVADARTAKVALAGAKISGRVLGKTGKVLVKGGGKTAKVAGKVGVKTGVTAGKLAGKGSLAAARGSVNGLANAGQKIAEKIIKPASGNAVKYGSHAMFKLVGRGTPIVKQTVKQSRSFTFNPVDLLLGN